jgi:hypothetical protein
MTRPAASGKQRGDCCGQDQYAFEKNLMRVHIAFSKNIECVFGRIKSEDPKFNNFLSAVLVINGEIILPVWRFV